MDRVDGNARYLVAAAADGHHGLAGAGADRHHTVGEQPGHIDRAVWCDRQVLRVLALARIEARDDSNLFVPLTVRRGRAGAQDAGNDQYGDCDHGVSAAAGLCAL